MGFWLKLFLFAAAGLIAACGLVFVVGMMLPREHVVARRLTLKSAAATAVWARVADQAAAPSWRSAVKSVRRLADRNGHEVWSEEDKSDESLAFETIEAREPNLLVRDIVDPTLFGGQWRIEVAEADGGTVVMITEAGWVEPALFRFMARFVFGHAATMETYLRDLAASFGEQPDIADTKAPRQMP